MAGSVTGEAAEQGSRSGRPCFGGGVRSQAPVNQATGLLATAQKGFVTGEVVVPQAVIPGHGGRCEQGVPAFCDPVQFIEAAAPGDESIHAGTLPAAEFGVRWRQPPPASLLLEEHGAEFEGFHPLLVRLGKGIQLPQSLAAGPSSNHPSAASKSVWAR